jgi:hypothetical protein
LLGLAKSIFNAVDSFLAGITIEKEYVVRGFLSLVIIFYVRE